MRLFNCLSLAIIVCCATFALGCKKNESTSTVDISETAQQVGDVMSSIDESAGSSGTGTYAIMNSEAKTFARLAPAMVAPPLFENLFLPKAEAAACSVASTWGTCATNVMTRNFGGCTIGGSTLTGSVTLTFHNGAGNNTCGMGTAGNVERVPNFTLTGRRGGTMTVTKTGTYGQRITKISTGVYEFSNDGINRNISVNGTTLFDFTTSTPSTAIGISGANRSGRVVNGGVLRVTNNVSGLTCDYTPSNVTWGSTCNCPTQGSWSGSCSDGRSTAVTLTGCGSGTLTLGTESESVSFDRCYDL